MTFRNPLVLRSALLTCCLAALSPAAHADEVAGTTTPSSATTTSTTSTGVGTSTTTESKLSAEFADFLGGTEQAGAVVTGLRQGTAFSLDDASSTSGTSGTSTSATSAAIDPPTGTMGYGNVRITLRLAQAELSSLGITQPTGDELSAVLLGGEINGTQVDGILTLRAEGMGWGRIARKYGMTVGQLMGKGTVLAKPSPTPAHATAKTGHVADSSAPSGHSSHARANGYIPDSTKPAYASHAHPNGYIPSSGGMVSAAGGSVGDAVQGGGKGQGHKITASAEGAGMVSAGGQQVSMAGGSNAGGGGKASAPGQGKRN